MSRVMLADSLLTVFRAAASAAARRSDCIRVDDMLREILAAADTTALRLAMALAPPEAWMPAEEHIPESELAVLLTPDAVRFDRAAAALVSLGADCVLLGLYEARHLAVAFVETAKLTHAPFRRFGFDPQAWRQIP